MTEENKGFSFFKLLLILCILGCFIGAGLLYTQKDPAQDWGTFLKEKALDLGNQIAPSAMPSVVQEKPTVSSEKVSVDGTAEEIISASEKVSNESKSTPKQNEPASGIEEEQIEVQKEVETLPEIEEEDFLVATEVTEDSQENLKNTEKAIPDTSLENDAFQEEQIEDNGQTSEESTEEESEAINEEVASNSLTDSKNKFLTSYSWQDFQSGKPCQPSEIFDDSHKEISNLIYSFCKFPDTDPWQKWLGTFREGKRTYYVQKTLSEKTKYIKYLKTIPYLLFDVYQTKTTGNSLADRFDQIETLIAKRQTQKAVQLLKDIPDELARLSLNTALMEGNHLLEIQKFLNNHSSEGENND